MPRKPLLTGTALLERARQLGVDTTGEGGAIVPGRGFVPFDAPDHELQRRVFEAERHHREHRLWIVAVSSALASAASALAAWAAVVIVHSTPREISQASAAMVQPATTSRDINYPVGAKAEGSPNERDGGKEVAPNEAASRAATQTATAIRQQDGSSGNADPPIAKSGLSGPQSVDYIYWTFSSAAQSISAFVALLLAGYAIVHTLMEAAREKDDSLEEIHAALRVKYHKQLAAFACITGAAILLSLYIVYVNRPAAATSPWMIGIGAVLDVAAIVGGLMFVIAIVNPRKYAKAAQQALKQGSTQIEASTQGVASGEFFDAFLHLERVVRDYLRTRDLYVPSRGSPQMSFSFRQMLEALLRNEKIDRAFYDELLEINKYRNLVFHGHVEDVDTRMVERVRAAASRLERLP